jgi:hypothetical protein
VPRSLWIVLAAAAALVALLVVLLNVQPDTRTAPARSPSRSETSSTPETPRAPVEIARGVEDGEREAPGAARVDDTRDAPAATIRFVGTVVSSSAIATFPCGARAGA